MHSERFQSLASLVKHSGMASFSWKAWMAQRVFDKPNMGLSFTTLWVRAKQSKNELCFFFGGKGCTSASLVPMATRFSMKVFYVTRTIGAGWPSAQSWLLKKMSINHRCYRLLVYLDVLDHPNPMINFGDSEKLQKPAGFSEFLDQLLDLLGHTHRWLSSKFRQQEVAASTHQRLCLNCYPLKSTNRAPTCTDLLVRHGPHGEALRINLNFFEHLNVVALIDSEAPSKHWILSQDEVSASVAVYSFFFSCPHLYMASILERIWSHHSSDKSPARWKSSTSPSMNPKVLHLILSWRGFWESRSYWSWGVTGTRQIHQQGSPTICTAPRVFREQPNIEVLQDAKNSNGRQVQRLT